MAQKPKISNLLIASLYRLCGTLYYPMTPDEFLSLTVVGNDRAKIEKIVKDSLFDIGAEYEPRIIYNDNGKVTGFYGALEAQYNKSQGEDEIWVILEGPGFPNMLIGKDSTFTVPLDHTKLCLVDDE